MLLCVAFRFVQKVFGEGEVGDCEVTQSKDSWQQSVLVGHFSPLSFK